MNDLARRIGNLSPEQRLLLAVRLGDARGVPEPIAIVGMGCRFPGAPNLRAYWQLLSQGQDAICEVPRDRWPLDDFYDADPTQPGKHYCRQGGFLDQIDQFEPEFFGIAPREAAYIDPQQRLLLEVMWEALEDAAIVPQALSGSKTGVFVGASTLDYGQLLLLHDDQISPYTTTGLASTMLANRISYLLNFQGPSLSVDTACSSSLVAVHLACQSLWRGESTVALAAGVNVMVTPSLTIGFSKLTALSPDGRCKTFDAAANGFVRAEGAGTVVLKPLSQALAQGDRIYALIRGGAINQDGRTNGLTAPNRESQEQVLRDAYWQARVPLAQVSYIEAHGTGTLLGDPIEAKALGNVFGPTHTEGPLIHIGSVKSNIGHTEAAAGIASLIKVALSLQHQTWVPSLHFHQPNPYIPFDRLPLQVQTKTQPWPEFSEHAIAGVSSFGFGGTNAHMVLQAPPPIPALDSALERPSHLLTLSARSETALRSLANQYLALLPELPEQDLANLCYTANTGRTGFNYRLVAQVATPAELQSALAAFAGGATTDSQTLQTTLPGPGEAPAVVWLFTGQGSQYPGMGQQLYLTQPVFRAALERCDEILRAYLDRPLLAILYPDTPEDGLIHQTSYTQPALFALEYALAQLWLSWGVKPAAVLGHSVGEYVAACVAGVFSLEDGLRLIAKRGQLMQSLPANGMMAAVMADAETVTQVIASWGDEVAIATLNGPHNTVIAGLREDVEPRLEEFGRRQLAVTPLTVSHAFHSPQMDPILNVFEHVAHQIAFQPPSIPLVTNLTGTFLAPGETLDATYWRRHARQPVRFAEGMAALNEQGYTHFLEIGPHPVLSRLGPQCLPQASDSRWLPSLGRQRDDWAVLGQSLKALYLDGVSINWQEFDQPYSRHKLALPTYPFQRSTYWIDWDITARPRLQSAASISQRGQHGLLGARLHSAALGHDTVQFEAQIQIQSPDYLSDHRVFDHGVVPASAWLEIALAAGTALFETNQIWVEEFALEQGLILDQQPVILQTLVHTQEGGTAKLEIFSRSLGDKSEPTPVGWTRHATGRLRKAVPAPTDLAPAPVPPAAGQALEVGSYYAQLQEQGLQYGPAFQTIRQLAHSATMVWGQVALSATSEAGSHYGLHPALLDGCFQLVGALLQEQSAQAIYLPIGVNRLQLLKPGQSVVTVWVQRVVPHGQSGELLSADLRLYTEHGQLVAEVEGLLLRRTNRDRLLQHLQPDISQFTYHLTWQPQAAPTDADDLAGNWLVLVEEDAIAAPIQTALTEANGRCIRVSIGSTYAQLSPDHYTVNPTEAGGFQLLFAAIADQPLWGIIHLWSLSAPTENLTDLEGSQQLVCGSTLHLLQELLAHRPTPRLWLVTQQAQAVIAGDVPAIAQSSLWGLGRVIALEHPELRCVRVDLSAPQDLPALMQELANPGEDQVAYRQQQRYVARLERFTLPTSTLAAGNNVLQATPVRLQSAGTGILTDLTLVPMARQAPGPGEVEIRVRATGLNFRDVLNALGMLQPYMAELGLEGTEIPFGGECSGEVVAMGDGVTGMAVGDGAIAALAIGSLGSYVTVPASLVVSKPASLNFEEAATLSTAFLTAYYGLCHLAQLKPGERVLIHAAAGGVGQAAVQIAQWRGAEVYATASPAKWEVLKAMGVKGVMNSRTLEFADELLALTQGQGVDVVLNSLTGDFIPKSLLTVAPQGRFVEIGKIGIWTPEQLAAERPDVTYFPFDLLAVAQASPDLIATLLQTIMAQFEAGQFTPLPYQAFPLEQVVDGFRYMAQAKHVGKVVITQMDQAEAAGESFPAQAIGPEGTYLITGGLGGLGLTVADWLGQQGARHLVLISRRGADESAKDAIAALETQGATVQIIQADMANAEDVEALITHIQDQMPPLRGIIHGAGILQDGLLRSQSWEQFWSVLAPKVQGSWNLHQFTQDLSLDFFLCFSSLASLLGSPGQGNYAAANGFMDTLAHYRRRQGRPGLSINWGPWAEVGMAARLEARTQARMAAQGVQPLPISKGLAALSALLDPALAPAVAQVAVMAINWPTFLKQFPPGERVPLLEQFYGSQAAAVAAQSAQPELIQHLAPLSSTDRRQQLQTYLQSEIAQVLGLSNPAEIEQRQRLFDLGLDSLMAVELKNRLEQVLGQSIPTTLLFDYPTIEALVDYFLEDVLIFEETAPQPGESSQDDRLSHLLTDLDALSDEEVLQILAGQHAKV